MARSPMLRAIRKGLFLMCLVAGIAAFGGGVAWFRIATSWQGMASGVLVASVGLLALVAAFRIVPLALDSGSNVPSNDSLDDLDRVERTMLEELKRER
jgi:hypothetical protein